METDNILFPSLDGLVARIRKSVWQAHSIILKFDSEKRMEAALGALEGRCDWLIKTEHRGIGGKWPCCVSLLTENIQDRKYLASNIVFMDGMRSLGNSYTHVSAFSEKNGNKFVLVDSPDMDDEELNTIRSEYKEAYIMPMPISCFMVVESVSRTFTEKTNEQDGHISINLSMN